MLSYAMLFNQKMDTSIKSIEELLSFFKHFKRAIFWVGRINRTIMLNLNDFLPNFELLVCDDPYQG